MVTSNSELALFFLGKFYELVSLVQKIKFFNLASEQREKNSASDKMMGLVSYGLLLPSFVPFCGTFNISAFYSTLKIPISTERGYVFFCVVFFFVH